MYNSWVDQAWDAVVPLEGADPLYPIFYRAMVQMRAPVCVWYVRERWERCVCGRGGRGVYVYACIRVYLCVDRALSKHPRSMPTHSHTHTLTHIRMVARAHTHTHTLGSLIDPFK